MTPRGPTRRGRLRGLGRAHACTPGDSSASTDGAAPLGRRRTLTAGDTSNPSRAVPPPDNANSIMVLAGDTLPIEVYCHLPVMCEDQNLPYVYIPSKTDLGAATGSKRPTCVIMVKPHEDYQEIYDKCLEEVQALPAPL
ncbi:H/ACA ribonucleoprotein complex subunit 2 [Microtus ochrogaster]|uniref:H/ACA ribonucleoprotein complex subunit 2 n=1 Tax=Microtus ochrogaster TaxID=79684 RepID=A0A8J6G8R2_MICOH|nr:H/ACA ribonucleoprotein complex subunit 2 [Microtus ochrogaster]